MHRKELIGRHLLESCSMENVISSRDSGSAGLKVADVSDKEFYLVGHIRILCLVFVAHIILLLFIS